MKVLVDSSVWIEYFRGSDRCNDLDFLITENLITVNELILAELLPSLHLHRKRKLIALMHEVDRLPMDIDWEEIVRMQTKCLRKGINKVGIPDLLIAQHAIRNELQLYSLDKHFKLIARQFRLLIY